MRKMMKTKKMIVRKVSTLRIQSLRKILIRQSQRVHLMTSTQQIRQKFLHKGIKYTVHFLGVSSHSDNKSWVAVFNLWKSQVYLYYFVQNKLFRNFTSWWSTQHTILCKTTAVASLTTGLGENSSMAGFRINRIEILSDFNFWQNYYID